MRRFILEIIYFLVPIVVLGFFFEVGLRSIPNSYKYKNDFLQNEANTIETLILGNSHAYYGINPEYLEQRSFNAANSAQSLKYDSKIFNKFFKTAGANLKNVIITVSYFSLYYDIESSKNRHLLKNYNIYYKLKTKFSDNFKFEVFSYDLYSNASRIYNYYIRNRMSFMCEDNGWLKVEKKEDLKSTGLANARRHDDYIENGDAMFDINVNYINDIISVCEEKNINVLFVTLPTSKFYRNNLNHEKWEMNVKLINDLVLTHSNCSYMNLLADSTFNNDDFFNADHLNSEGAKKLSTIINDALVR